jgi:steroid delta-isomerase-like uncharacterized protein
LLENVLNQGQLDRMNDLVAVDFVELDPLPGQQRGREGLDQVIAAFRTAFPDIQCVIEEMVAEHKVSSRTTWHDTHHGGFFGVPATGRQITGCGRRSRRCRRAGGQSNSNGYPGHDGAAWCHSCGEIGHLAKRGWSKQGRARLKRAGSFRKGLGPLPIE